jgi:DNA-binding transcriptional MerR regulator
VSKAAEAFRTISEVAEELDVPKHVLRFWEVKFPQVRPMKRGGGRRYYRPEDLELLRGIRHLLHVEGYTIRGVQKILRSQGVEQVKQSGRPPAETPQAGFAAPTQGVPVGTHVERRADATSSIESAAGSSAVARELTPAQRRLIEAAIAELESCRRLLTSAPEAVVARRARSRR